MCQTTLNILITCKGLGNVLSTLQCFNDPEPKIPRTSNITLLYHLFGLLFKI